MAKRPSIRRVFRAAIEKILAYPSHPQHRAFKEEFGKDCAMELFRQYDWMETQFMVIVVCRSLNVRGSIFAPNADGISCGLRLKSEDLTLRWHDIDVTRGTLTMQAACAKTGKPRTIPMNSLVREALQRLPRKSEWVFTKPNGKPYTAVRGFDTVRKAVGLLDVVSNTEKFAVTIHTLRHTFAARLIENGIDL